MDNEIEFFYIGWCHGTKETRKNGIRETVTSDKVWAAFTVGGGYYAAWGARGKTIRFKKHDDWDSLDKVKRSKLKDYEEVDAFQLFSIFPTFKEDVSTKLLMATLTGTVM